MNNTVIKIESKEEYDAVMQKLEGMGIKWYEGENPTQYSAWGWHSADDFGVFIDHERLSYGSCVWLKNSPYYTLISAKQFLTGEIMKYTQGQVLVDRDGDKKKILGVCGEVYILSRFWESDPADDQHERVAAFLTQFELDEQGYTLLDETVEELTVEEISQRLGKTIKVVKK